MGTLLLLAETPGFFGALIPLTARQDQTVPMRFSPMFSSEDMAVCCVGR